MTAFVKSHGLGNDYLVVAEDDLDFALTPAAVRCLCHRSLGVGADGVLLRVAPRDADFAVRIFNPDGSEAEKSGNGLRIFAKWLVDHGHARVTRFTVDTAGGRVACECRVEAGRVRTVAVEMGRATFDAAAIPVRGVAGDAVAFPLDVAGARLALTAVSVGNPHCVLFVERLDEAEARRLGPLLETHPAFPNRTNVQLAVAEARNRVAILIWERGAGFTLASGSSSCAAAAAAVRTGRADPGRVTVGMPGGELVVEVRRDWSLRLEGSVAEICAGTLSAELIASLRAP